MLWTGFITNNVAKDRTQETQKEEDPRYVEMKRLAMAKRKEMVKAIHTEGEPEPFDFEEQEAHEETLTELLESAQAGEIRRILARHPEILEKLKEDLKPRM